MPKTYDAQQLTLWPEALHRNHYLFSDYYLNERLPSLPDWQNPSGLSTAIDKVKTIWISVRDTIDKTKEPQTREQLINPVLKVLGHVYESEPSLPTNHGVKAPDYAIFPDTSSMKRAASKRGSIDYFKQAIAVAEAKRYGRPLDQKSREGTDPFDNNNPGYQIDYYLRTTGLRWGILTDGRYWRLYNLDTSFKLNKYYEVDLASLVQQNDEQAFKYFYLFFRREAFTGVENQESFLDLVFRESVHYAQAVSDKLKRAVYDALETLCEGFVKFEKNDLNLRLHLTAIYDNSLILLYRLLFIFYAESRGLLPLETNKSYRENYSLYHLRMDIAKRIDSDEEIPKDLPNYWSQLKNLFRSINEGSSSIDVYQYNGGLFDPSRHEFLESYDIGDFYLAKAVDLLARTENEQEKKREFVDYRDLAIQHLGSIYEGLLEHKPRVADDEMVIVREKGREKVVPRTELQNQRVYGEKHQGEIYLALEKGERKAIGSYYTPDYIVKYIVENTLAPLINEKIEGWRKRVTDLEAKAKAARGENCGLLEKELEAARGSLANQIMSLRVLDPAMGSGHFLVRATERLAEELATNPYIPAPRHDEDIEDVDYWKRRVVERCIYGVDINTLAVELAKVSLWLATVARNKPLNFLDHHLRCGNSLIGARIADLGSLLGKAPKMKRLAKRPLQVKPSTMWEDWLIQNVATAVDNYFRISSISSDTIGMIRDKEQLYGVGRQALRRYFQVAHIWTSTYFGNKVAPQNYDSLLSNIRASESEWVQLGNKRWFAEAVKMGEGERRFFHWELEFPEVFFDRNGKWLSNPGFDAVIGNPPYVGFHGFGEMKTVLRRLFTTCRGKFDIYIPFWEKSLQIIRNSGAVTFICPSGFMKREHGRELRRLISNHMLVSLHDFEHSQVFEGVTNYTCIPTLLKGRDSSQKVRTLVGFGDNPKSPEFCGVVESLTDQISGWKITSNIAGRGDISFNRPYLLPLSKIAEVVSEGIVTGKNDVFLVDYKGLGYSGEPIKHPSLRGECVDRYDIDWDGTLLIYPYKMVGNRTVALDETTFRSEALKTYEYLVDQKEELARRPYFNRSGKVWYELWNQRNMGHQSHQKLVVQENSVRCEFTYDSGEYFYIDTCCGVSLPSTTSLSYFYLLALLNSLIIDFAFRIITVPKAGGHYIHKPMFLGQIPIRCINFATPQAEREQLVKQCKKLYLKYLESKDWGKLISFVSQRLPQKSDGTPDLEREQSDVVHDLLAFLAEEMTRLHKEKQAEMKGFLAWLEGYVCVSVNDMKNKTKVKEYWKADVEWEGLLSALKQNQKAIQSASGIDVTRREPQEEKIRPEFEASMAKLRPILERIGMTDNLIDQIVYKAYGLTEQEIALVEKSLVRAPQETEQVEVS